MANTGLEPTCLTVRAIMSPRHAAQAARLAGQRTALLVLDRRVKVHTLNPTWWLLPLSSEAIAVSG
jgi:hypothetical protein